MNVAFAWDCPTTFAMLDVDFLEPERLRAFVAVAELKSFSRAAERLHWPPPPVSIQVRRV